MSPHSRHPLHPSHTANYSLPCSFEPQCHPSNFSQSSSADDLQLLFLSNNIILFTLLFMIVSVPISSLLLADGQTFIVIVIKLFVPTRVASWASHLICVLFTVEATMVQTGVYFLYVQCQQRTISLHGTC